MKKFERFRSAFCVRPKPPTISRKAWLGENGGLNFCPSKYLQRAPLAGVENEVEALFVLAAGDHRHEQLFRARHRGEALELPNLASPNLLQVIPAGFFLPRPELHQDAAPVRIARRQQTGPAPLRIWT